MFPQILIQLLCPGQALLEKNLRQTIRELMRNCGPLAHRLGNFSGRPLPGAQMLQHIRHARLCYHDLALGEDIALRGHGEDVSLGVVGEFRFWDEPFRGDLGECGFAFRGGDV